MANVIIYERTMQGAMRNMGIKNRNEEVGKAIGGRFSTAVVLFHSAVAGRMGVNVTDWKCAEILARSGPINPGKLSDMTGMTTAATTQVINRLEKAGMLKRERDSQDRRKVTVCLVENPKTKRLVQSIFIDLGQEMGKMMAKYNMSELDVIAGFIQNTAEILEAQAQKLHKDSHKKSKIKVSE